MHHYFDSLRGSKQKFLRHFIVFLGLLFVVGGAFADGNNPQSTDNCLKAATSLGSLAENITCSFRQIAKLMIGVAYVAGIGFGISSVFKFKQYKDNPTQVPVGTPFALLFISVVLIYLPSLYGPAGKTIFGTTKAEGGGFKGEKGVAALTEVYKA